MLRRRSSLAAPGANHPVRRVRPIAVGAARPALSPTCRERVGVSGRSANLRESAQIATTSRKPGEVRGIRMQRPALAGKREGR
jgi:hypothetical protein